jgi:hypothetical protein
MLMWINGISFDGHRMTPVSTFSLLCFLIFVKIAVSYKPKRTQVDGSLTLVKGDVLHRSVLFMLP